jgi:hypothetical protein
MRWLKRRLIGWLLKDVEIEELKVRKLRIGESTVTIDANSITLPALTADPALAEGKLWYRADLDRLQYAIDTATKREIPFGTIDVDAHASRHVAGGADAIPSGGIARSQLEYPTVDVYFPYLEAISKCRWYGPGVGVQGFWHFGTVDSFTDKSLWAPLPNIFHIAMRMTDGNNTYTANLDSGATTADFILDKRSAGTTTSLAAEAVDIGSYDVYQVVGSISGSTLNGYRDSSYTTSPTLKISATDTTFASGAFGYTKRRDYIGSSVHEGYALLKASLSPLPPALAILELNVDGTGKPSDPFRPAMSKSLAEISSLAGLPDFLYAEAKKYSILKAKGFTDEEIKTIFGYIPQHQVDLDSVTWGAFELHPDKAPTTIITITGDNPYKSGAILRQIELARKKNLKVLSPPRDYREATALYSQLKRDYPHWLAGKDNFAYQTLGWEILDWFQNIDFYYGELLEHKTHYQQLKQVSDREITIRLNELIDRLSKETALTDERDKHIGKAKEILKKGW